MEIDYLKTINLGYGKGTPGKKACWMTALNSHMGGEWTDQCACVDPTINELCIIINDSYGNDDKARTEDIMKFGLFRPLGTYSKKDEIPRQVRLCEIVESWIPYLLYRNIFIQSALEAFKTKLSILVDHKNPLAAQAALRLNATQAALHLTSVLKMGSYPEFKFVHQYLYPLLDELITMGLHAPDEPGLPVCGVDEFLELTGSK